MQTSVNVELDYQELQRKYRDLEERFEQVVTVQDILFRTLRNPKMSATYQKLYIAMIDLYPALLDGTPMSINVWKIRESAGWASEKAATDFFQDMQTICAVSYDPGKYNKKTNERLGWVIPNADVFPYPETFATKATEKRRKAREKEQEKRDAWKNALLILECQNCSSPNIKYSLHPVCGSCGHIHNVLENIAVERLTITPDMEEDTDDWENFVEERQAPAPMLQPQQPQVLPAIITFPRCQHWKCATGPQRIEKRALGLYCTGHNGYINERGITA